MQSLSLLLGCWLSLSAYRQNPQILSEKQIDIWEHLSLILGKVRILLFKSGKHLDIVLSSLFVSSAPF